LKAVNDNEVDGFLRTDGQRLVNGSGQEVLLRGVGFGSWLLPEGYMWRFPEAGDRPRRIERMIRELIGADKAQSFWDKYYDVYVAEADIRRIAAEGFNSVRVPINARFLLREESEAFDERRLAILDRLIGWCRTYRVYVILDLHGAPGGQTGTNIDDSADNEPGLFLEEANKRLTIRIWRMLAERYKDEWIVAGYDLLNEPLPDWFAMYNDQVMPLYKEITRSIREVDDRHIIIVEGAHWATDWSIFDEKFDDNVMLQFHKYWNNPDTESIRKFLDKRAEWDVPIYMGEGGENNIEWYIGAFRLFEDHRISWNFWTWKKLDTTNSPCSVLLPDSWSKLVDYLEGGAAPDAAEAERTLWAYLDNLPLERCAYRPEVVNALLFRPPVRIPAIFYGYQGEGISYGIGRQASSGIGFREHDGTDIRFTDSERTTPNFAHGRGEAWQPDEWLHVRLMPGDWLAYEVNAGHEPATRHRIELRACAPAGRASAELIVDGRIESTIAVAGAGWQTVAAPGRCRLSPGSRTVIVKAGAEPLWVEWIGIGADE